MITIWKFDLIQHADEIVENPRRLIMPKGSRILCVHGQDNMPRLWAVVDTEAPKVKRLIQICGTGGPSVPGEMYIGSIFLNDGAFVLHCFDHGETP